jgi:hypothetical protein
MSPPEPLFLDDTAPAGCTVEEIKTELIAGGKHTLQRDSTPARSGEKR